MVYDKDNGDADGCNAQAFGVEGSSTTSPKAVEGPTADHCSGDPKRNVENYALAAPIDDLAGDEAGNESKDRGEN